MNNVICLWKWHKCALFRMPDEHLLIIHRLGLAIDRQFNAFMVLPKFKFTPWGWQFGWMTILVIWYQHANR